MSLELLKATISYRKLKATKNYYTKVYMNSGYIPYNVVEFNHISLQEEYVNSLVIINNFQVETEFDEKLISLVFKTIKLLSDDLGYDQYDSGIARTIYYKIMWENTSVTDNDLTAFISILNTNFTLEDQLLQIKLMI